MTTRVRSTDGIVHQESTLQATSTLCERKPDGLLRPRYPSSGLASTDAPVDCLACLAWRGDHAALP